MLPQHVRGDDVKRLKLAFPVKVFIEASSFRRASEASKEEPAVLVRLQKAGSSRCSDDKRKLGMTKGNLFQVSI